MRIIVMFDLPTGTSQDRKTYRAFRKLLLSEGFLMLQESVYSKLVINQTSVNLILKRIRKNKPTAGYVFILTVTEKQYSKMEFLVGNVESNILDTTERLVVL